MKRFLVALALAAIAASSAHSQVAVVARPQAPYTQNYLAAPPQWNEASNSVTCIGAGGGGASGFGATKGGSGGGGGAASQATNIPFEGWLSTNWQTHGIGGTPGNPGQNGSGTKTEVTQYYGGTVGCGANSGNRGNGSTPGTGGAPAAGFSGFNGGSGAVGGADTLGSSTCTPVTCGGGGAGGAAGPAANGLNGTTFSGATGGAGGAGDNGSGGAGGAHDANGANGTEITGSGSGGGAGGGSNGSPGKTGGQCGGGGSGAGDNTQSGGDGDDSCIIFVYTPTNDVNLGFSGSPAHTHSDVQAFECGSWTAPISGMGSSVFYSLQSSFTGHFVLGVYDASGNAGASNLPGFAGALISQTGVVTNPGSGLHSAALNASVSFTRGNLYWVCFLSDGTVAWDASNVLVTDPSWSMAYSATMPSNVGATTPGVVASDYSRKIYVPIALPPAIGMPNPMFEGN